MSIKHHLVYNLSITIHTKFQLSYKTLWVFGRFRTRKCFQRWCLVRCVPCLATFLSYLQLGMQTGRQKLTWLAVFPLEHCKANRICFYDRVHIWILLCEKIHDTKCWYQYARGSSSLSSGRNEPWAVHDVIHAPKLLTKIIARAWVSCEIIAIFFKFESIESEIWPNNCKTSTEKQWYMKVIENNKCGIKTTIWVKSSRVFFLPSFCNPSDHPWDLQICSPKNGSAEKAKSCNTSGPLSLKF